MQSINRTTLGQRGENAPANRVYNGPVPAGHWSLPIGTVIALPNCRVGLQGLHLLVVADEVVFHGSIEGAM